MILCPSLLLLLLWFNPARDWVSTLSLVSNVIPPVDLIDRCLGTESTRSWFQVRFGSNFIVTRFYNNHKFINFNNSNFEGCVKYMLSRAALVSESILEWYNACFLLCQLFSTAHCKMWNQCKLVDIYIYIYLFIVIYIYIWGRKFYMVLLFSFQNWGFSSHCLVKGINRSEKKLIFSDLLDIMHTASYVEVMGQTQSILEETD